MARASFQLDDSLEDYVESRLVYGQAKSAWYRYAIKSVMQVEEVLDQVYEPYQYDKRQELIEAAVKREVERRKREAGANSE